MDDEELDELLSVVRDGLNYSSNELSVALDQITDFFQNNISDVEAQVYVAMAVDIKLGLLKYLSDVAYSEGNQTNHDNASKCFLILEFLVSNFKTAVEPHTQSIIKWSLGKLLGVHLRNPVLKLVKQVINNCSCSKVDMNEVVLKLKSFLDNNKKLGATLRHDVLVLLGDICVSQPSAIADISDYLLSTILCYLADNQISKYRSVTLVEGCFIALYGYFTNFPLPDEKSEVLYSHMKEFMTLGEAGEKHTANRAALNLLVKHPSFFSTQLYKDSTVLGVLSKWIEDNQSAENKKLGLLALTVTYRQFCSIILSLSDEEAREPFENLKKDLEILLQKEKTIYGKKKAVISISELSSLYIKFGCETELVSVLSSFLAIADNVTEIEAWTISIYVEAVSKILAVLKNPILGMSQLCRLSIKLINSYPKIPSNFRLSCCEAIENSFISLSCKSLQVFDSYVRTVVYQGLIRSCSYQLHLDTLLVEDGGLRSISNKSFLPMWSHLLTITSRTGSSMVGSVVYDNFISVFLETIKKLDLNLVSKVVDRSDPSLAYDAQTPNDFLIFINMVDLFQDIIPNTDSSLLYKWLPCIFQEIMGLSRNSPLISGFYKILAVTFQADIGYTFDDLLMAEITTFLNGALRRVVMMKDDLQISCLLMILNAPVSFIEHLVDTIDVAVIAALRIGSGYPTLLQLCMSSLDLWLSKLSSSQMKIILGKVLPFMRGLLQSPGNNQQGIKIKNFKKGSLKASGKVKKRIVDPSERRLLTLQKQFIIFLGKLEPDLCSGLIEPTISNETSNDNPLYYNLPLHDSRPKLNLNGFLPRVVDLALSSGDRHTRVTACEVLHAVFLIAIERTRQPNSNPELFRRLLQAALVLSSDSDKVVHDLFNPLLLQVCRYYSGKAQMFSKETAVLIDVLNDGCTHPYDSSLRDFSALCIREFVEWSRKQNPEAYSKSPANAGAVIRNICEFASHPDHSKRVGASVIFNAIYKEIREDSNLMSTYWFQLYQEFMSCLERCNDEESARIIIMSVEHIRRPFVEMKHIFLLNVAERRIPSMIPGGTLVDLLKYTFGLCQSENVHVRKVAWETTMTLLKVIPGKPTLKEFLALNNISVYLNYESQKSKNSLVDYINSLIEENVVSLKTIENSTFLSFRTSYLSQVVELANPQLEDLKRLLRLLKNTAVNLQVIDLQNIAALLFKLKLPVKNEFVAFLSRLRCNATASIRLKKFLPTLDITYLNTALNSGNNLEFFIGFDILDASLFLSETYIGDDVLQILLNSLFSSSRGRRVDVKFLEPVKQVYMKKFFDFAVKCGVKFETMVKFLNDDTEVMYVSNKSSKADVIVKIFKDEILNYFVKLDQEGEGLLKLGKIGVKWLLWILEEGSYSEEYASNIFGKWEEIKEIVESDPEVILTFLKLISVNQSSGYFSNSKSVCDYLYNLLGSKDKCNSYISPVFELLHHVSLKMEVCNADLSNALTTFRRIQYMYFDMGPNTLRSEYFLIIQAIYRGLFSSIKNTGSLVSIKFAAESISVHAEVVPPENLDSSLHSLLTTFPPEHIEKIAVELLNSVLSAFIDSKSAFCICERLSVLLQFSTEQVITNFFNTHISRFYEIIVEQSNTTCDRLQLRNKISCIRLLEVLYVKTNHQLRIEILNNNPNKPNLFKNIIKKCSYWCLPIKERELWRLYYCACVKFLCTFVCQASEEKLFDQYLFKLPIWNFVVDFEKKYNFGMDFSQVPKRKKIMTSIRQNRSANQVPLIYPQSQVLFESSLKEDVTRFDLSNSTITQDPYSVECFHEGLRVVELELDTLNQHEVMATVCGVLEHMIAERITPHGQIPCWLTSLNTFLSSITKPTNATLFVLKIMHNVATHIKPFADETAPIILKSLLLILPEIGTNYFVMDIIAMILLWRPKLTDQGVSLSLLIKDLVTHPNTTRKDIAKYIIEIVKNMVEEWKDLIDYTDIANFLLERVSNTDEFETYINLYLTSILLTNKIYPTTKTYVEKLANWLLNCSKDNNNNYQLASEVLGQALNSWRGMENFEAFFEQLSGEIFKLGCKKSKDAASNIIRFHSIHNFFPEISSNEYICAKLEGRAILDGSIVRQHCLEMLSSHVKRGNNLHEPKNLIIEGLKSATPVIIILTIEILREIVNKIDKNDLKEIIELIIKLTNSTDEKVCLKSCEILSELLRIPQFVPGELLDNCYVALLKRLKDSDEEVRKICETFWYNSKLSSKNSSERLLAILNEMYYPEAESDFLLYAPDLVLMSAAGSYDYDRSIFDHPLAECSYTDYKVLVSWRARHSSLAPMFVPSVAGELGRLELDQPLAPSAFHEQIRATARSLLFSPTLADEPMVSDTNLPASTADEGLFKKPKTPFRFYKTDSRVMFARRAVTARDKADAEIKDRIKRIETDVKLYRNYKKGDYPDIQIKNSHFLAPLAALSRKDPPLAKQLLLQLFASITGEAPDREEFLNKVGVRLNSMIETTSYYDSIFLSFAFELSLENDLILNSENVCIASKSSGLLILGTLVVERNIIQSNVEVTFEAKRQKKEEDEVSERWLHLAQLYQELQDADAQQGIFLDKLSVEGSAHRGILEEAAQNWVSALKSYENALGDSEVRNQFYCQAYLKCLANLGDWSSINRCILENLDSKDQLWEDQWRSEVLLPLFMRSELMISLENNSNDFQNFVGNVSGVSALSARYSLELTIASWLDKNFPKTVTYFNQSCLGLLSNWSYINMWDTKRKESWLTSLQLLYELSDIVEFLSALSQESAITQTLDHWEKITPRAKSDLFIWDTRLALRQKFCSSLVDLISDSDMELVKSSVLNSEMSMIEAALDVEHFHLAKKYLKLSNDARENPQWQYCRDSAAILGVKLNEMEPELKIGKYFEAWQRIDFRLEQMDDPCGQLPAKLRRLVLTAISSIFTLKDEYQLDINSLSIPDGKKNLKECWLKNAEASIKLLGDGSKELIQKGQVYLEIAKFHKKYSGPSFDILMAILKGMKCNNKEARQLFCWALTMNDVIETSEMLEECDNVPTWMFLLWRHQLLAFYAAKKSNLVKSIIQRLAQEYPKALSHGLRVNLESYESSVLQDEFVKNIQLACSDPMEETFVTALNKVVVPSLKMRYYLEKAQDKGNDLVGVREVLREIAEFINVTENGDAYRCLDPFRGKIGNLLKEEDGDVVKRSLKDLAEQLRPLDTLKSDKSLKLYSPWLYSFRSMVNCDILEVPGQYDDDIEPRVSNHIRIAGFKPTLLCLSSKRRPFKISILGNDAKEYDFLLKFGEDLRQDQRIQQALKEMQATLKGKKLTRDLELDCYRVIPLTSSCGLIEWLGSTKSLRELVSTKVSISTIYEVHKRHLLFLGAGESRAAHAYKRAFQNIPDESAVTEYLRGIQMFPEYAMRSAFFGLCSSPEQLAYFRRNFAKSLAVMSIAHWLIGVGDRHDENILISSVTGRAVGIDFGVAFGFATQFLMPPELIPFRLTPQIINTFSPLKESGWLKQTMIRALRVLRENAPVLLAMLEVFVLEPSMDWKQQAKRLAKDQGSEEVSSAWYPRQKVRAVERKLNGANPCSELEVDLISGHQGNASLNRFLDLLKGKPGKNARTTVPADKLTPEEQVSCLIDLAMDPLVLSFTYVGWNPWM